MAAMAATTPAVHDRRVRTGDHRPSDQLPSPGTGWSSGRLARLSGRGATLVGALGIVLLAIDLTTRPPCPPRDVRLIDFEALAPVVPVFVALLGVAVARIARSPASHRAAAVVGGALLAVAALVVVLTSAALVAHHSPGYDSSSECWTF
jgi:hypothetical protein